MEERRYSFWLFSAKTILVHTVTHYITGLLALLTRSGVLILRKRVSQPASALALKDMRQGLKPALQLLGEKPNQTFV